MEFTRSIYLGGEVIYANDKRLNNNSYKEWGLYCPECGEEVHLRHGSIREPYFAHFKQITDTECSLRVSIEGDDEGRWTEVEIGRGQRRELFQQHFLALVATNDRDFYIKIAKVKDSIDSNILLFLTKEVKKYLVKNAIEIIEISVQFYRNKSNRSKFKALNENIINEAIEYLCVESSLNILQQLIYYCISYSEQLIKKDAGNVENTNIVRYLINKLAVIIANTDWAKEIFTLKSHNLLHQKILLPVEQTPDNLADHSQARKLNGELRDAKTPNSYQSYIVPTYQALTTIKETIDKSIKAILSRIEKLQVQIDFWKNDENKQNDLTAIRKKLQLNKRLLTIFAGKYDIAGKVILPGLKHRVENIPTKPAMLESWFKDFSRQYMFAVKANMAIVKKLNVRDCIQNKCNDEKWLQLINDFTPQLELATVYDLTVLNTESQFRGIDNTTMKGNSIVVAKAGYTGSVLHGEVRESVNTNAGNIRQSLIPSTVKVIDRKAKEKSQTTFGKKQPYINTDGKTLGSLINLPSTLYRTTSNLYWLLDTSYQGYTLVEDTDNTANTVEVQREFTGNICTNTSTRIVKKARYAPNPNSGLIAAIRVSKHADYGYFNIGELFINKHRQIAYRLPKKSIAFLLENLAIPFDEICEGFAKLGLWRKDENSSRYYNGVINRSLQTQLKGGQLDILTDHVLYDLGVEIKRFKNDKGQGTYAVTKLLYPKYTTVESFVNVDMGIDPFPT